LYGAKKKYEKCTYYLGRLKQLSSTLFEYAYDMLYPLRASDLSRTGDDSMPATVLFSASWPAQVNVYDQYRQMRAITIITITSPCTVNEAIDTPIKQDRKDRRNVVQILLLGAGEPGKVHPPFVSRQT